MARGYFGVAFWQPKTLGNLGAALRSAQCFDAAFVAIIGARYERQPADTGFAERHVPLFHFDTMPAFLAAVPRLGTLVSLEVDGATDVRAYAHPERAVYLLGGEDRTLPQLAGDRIRIDTRICLNMAVAASIILYDRSLKRRRVERLAPSLAVQSLEAT